MRSALKQHQYLERAHGLRVEGEEENDSFVGIDNNEITVEEYVNWIGIGRFQFTLLAIFGLLVAGDGMEMVVISLLYPALRAQWGLSSTQEGMLASAVFAGLVLGNVLGGHLGDHIGRRFTLLAAGVLFLIASAASSMAPDFVSLCCFRAIVGLAVGAKGPAAMAVLVEVSPAAWRGRLGLMEVGMAFALGEVFVCVACIVLPEDMTLLPWWRAVMLSCAVPAAVALPLAWRLAPESPHYLALHGRTEEVASLLTSI
eukprot:CAMPEP_0172178530 /NCGR_PEP_ID=MMETSP1050-20130122/16093_1 /TAXON_ID=233186 /ORGANISM="Cryptomonas curvata, Strain CCAP979/52" /LENGTH=256 /DNA_ID=CAMNT_0012851271 /DNA_START=76 /DNA_END=843 /DNA_ORIENTATION=-